MRDGCASAWAFARFQRPSGAPATGRGAGLGFPTANLARPEVAIPRAGVYATLATLATPAGSEKARPAVTCIGCKPTFGENELSVETFLLEGGGDLYGRTLRLDFVERLRG